MQDREQTREAATKGVEELADFSEKSLKQAEALRSLRKEEQSQLAAERRLTFRQKVCKLSISFLILFLTPLGLIPFSWYPIIFVLTLKYRPCQHSTIVCSDHSNGTNA